jgi:hypothetical protein
MRFSELVKCTPWLEVEVSFLDYYGVHSEKFKKRIRKKKIKKFQDIYVKLNNIVPVETNWRIVVSKYIEENEFYADVSGINNNLEENEEDIPYGLGGTPSEEWLGMVIEPSSFESFSNSEITAHCLWELTFYGFPED